jgi:hypothetical protein
LRDSYKFSGKRVEIYTTNDEFKLKIYGAWKEKREKGW